MRKLILIASMLLAMTAHAQQMVARDGEDSARITSDPCPPAVLKWIAPGRRGFFKLAFSVVDGQTHMGCWALQIDGIVVLVYADGIEGHVPAALFKVDPGT